MKTLLKTLNVPADRWITLQEQLRLPAQEARFLFLSSDHPAPVELCTDYSEGSASRVVLPAGDLGDELSRIEVQCPLYLRLAPRHTPEAVTADQPTPSASGDGFSVVGLPGLRVWAGGGGTAQLLVWGFNGAFWAPLTAPTPVPAAGVVLPVALEGVTRIQPQLTGVSGTVQLRTSASGLGTDQARVTVQAWW